MSPEGTSLDNLRAKVDEVVRPYLNSPSGVGLVVGVIRGDETHVFGFGKLAKDRDAVPDENTLFEIGSITKVFTANLLADMVVRGEVRLDDPVRKLLPPSMTVPSYGTEEITLFHLATHTSALPRLPTNLDATIQDDSNPYAHYTVDHLYQFLARYRLTREPGTWVDYSNLGTGLLGHALALANDKSYEAVIVERVCRPLGLCDTTISLSDEQRTRFAVGHSATGEPVANWDLPTLAGAGALRSSAAEMMRYLLANLDPPATPLGRALEMCQVVYPLRNTLRTRMLPYLLAICFAVLGLAVQRFGPVEPGWWLFFLVFEAPLVAAALYGGIGPGLVALGLSVVGSLLLWGDGFGWWQSILASLPFVGGFSLTHWFAPRQVLLGWHLEHAANKGLMLWHNGGTGGYRSYTGFVRASRTAVVVLANSETEIDHLGLAILRYLHETSNPPIASTGRALV